MAFLPVQALLVAPLENRFPQPPFDLVAPTGIIVLGGATEDEIAEARGQVALNDAAARLTTGASLARRFPDARLVFTGGSASLKPVHVSEADSVRRLWTELGVSQRNVLYEDRSRNTWENAIYTRELVQPKPGEKWLLVTSAMHMPRAMGIFRKAGFDVVPYPTDYKTLGTGQDICLSGNAARSLGLIDIAAHEWIGLIVYWATGKSTTIFPEPRALLPSNL